MRECVGVRTHSRDRRGGGGGLHGCFLWIHLEVVDLVDSLVAGKLPSSYGHKTNTTDDQAVKQDHRVLEREEAVAQERPCACRDKGGKESSRRSWPDPLLLVM